MKKRTLIQAAAAAAASLAFAGPAMAQDFPRPSPSRWSSASRPAARPMRRRA